MTSDSKHTLIQHSRKWDRAGLTASIVCLIHCLAAPIAVLAYPSFSHSMTHNSLHLILLPIVMGVAFLSFVSSYRQHQNRGPIFLGSLGILLLFGSFFAGEVFHSADTTIPAIVGSLILIGSHIWNIHACHCFCEHSCSHSTHQH